MNFLFISLPIFWYIICTILLNINYELLIIFGFFIMITIINKNSKIIFNFFKEDIEKQFFFFYDLYSNKIDNTQNELNYIHNFSQENILLKNIFNIYEKKFFEILELNQINDLNKLNLLIECELDYFCEEEPQSIKILHINNFKFN